MLWIETYFNLNLKNKNAKEFFVCPEKYAPLTKPVQL
jgi:hypothetical protein